MTTMNISLPNSMRAFVEQQVECGSYSSASEYVRQLIREDLKRTAQQRLEGLLLEGVHSGGSLEITAESLQEKKATLLKRAQEHRT